MSKFTDVKYFHDKFELYPWLGGEADHEERLLRISQLQEEVAEYVVACIKGDKAEQLDALIDLVYFSLGTAYLSGFDFDSAWDVVQAANMKKVRALSAEDSKRGSSFDVVKPPGWKAPDLSKYVDYFDDDVEL